MAHSHSLDRSIYYLLLLYTFSSTISIAGSNIAISLALCLLIYRYYRQPFCLDLPRGLIKVIGLFFLTAILSSFFAYQPLAAMERVWGFLYRMAPLLVAVFVVREQKQIVYLLTTVAISLGISDGYALWQGLHGDYRAEAFGSHPMILAGYLVQLLPLFLVVALEGKELSGRLRFAFLALTMLSMVALLYNGTRGAWIAVVVTILLYGVLSLRRNPKLVAILILGFVLFSSIAVIGIPQVENRIASITDKSFSSNTERVLMWKSAWQMFADHWLTGVGPGNYGELYRGKYILPEARERQQDHAHNNYLHTVAEMGSIGLAAFCVLFGYILYTQYQAAKKQHILSLAVLLATVGLLIQGFTEYNFGNSAVMRLYWFLVGLSFAKAD